MTAIHQTEWTGLPAAPGTAIGTGIWLRSSPAPAVEEIPVNDEDVQRELSRLGQAIERVRLRIRDMRRQTAARLGESEAAIFDAHLAFLDDPAYVGEMKRRIPFEKKNAEWICRQLTDETAAMLEQLPDEYLRARSHDVRSVGDQLIEELAGRTRDAVRWPEEAVVIAEDLAPSELMQLPREVVALALLRGSRIGHAAILARAMGIPMVVGLGEEFRQVRDGQVLIVDGQSGLVRVDPDGETAARARERIQNLNRQRQQALTRVHEPARTEDGVAIRVLANMGNPSEIQTALSRGAEGVGLFRTEFLYLERSNWPAEEEQFRVYREMVEAFRDRPVVIRTLDIGGDKLLPYEDREPEDNPFLGLRGIRFCLARPDIFKAQLRAMLRAGAFGDLRILLPMVIDAKEVAEVKGIIYQCREELRNEGTDVPDRIPIGVMVETPAAAILAGELAKEADFLSIGTNDLTQYTLAVDRNNARIAHLFDHAHPAVLRLIQHTCEAAAKSGVPVSICGELAADPEMTGLLLKYGVRTLSMNPEAIPLVKEAVRRTRIHSTG
ncbi:MAG: phosphoenolpyruvate--protein phosphotransferase [Kyrpidia sp.]|nr:phosphoenolpyruvate--protein phosphotransferase [Kyrpidia sp.]